VVRDGSECSGVWVCSSRSQAVERIDSLGGRRPQRPPGMVRRASCSPQVSLRSSAYVPPESEGRPHRDWAPAERKGGAMSSIHDATQPGISGGCPGVAMVSLVGLVASAQEGERHIDLAPCNADYTGRHDPHGVWSAGQSMRIAGSGGGYDMAPMMNRGERAHGGTGIHEVATPSCLTTTLYDLIAAIQDGLSPDDAALVVTTVLCLLRSGRLTWLGKTRARPGSSQRAAMEAMPRVSPRTTAEMSSFTGQRAERTP
jgi:hypothetical protein